MRPTVPQAKRWVAAAGALALLAGTARGEVLIDWVTVGNPGNIAYDDGTPAGIGAVGSVYRIGKYEVTNAQYVEFLNAVAASDTYDLYPPPDMRAVHGIGGIERHGTDGTYTYSVAADYANRPVNSLSFWSAVRFANWLHNGQPRGKQDATTTEDGAYTLNGYNGSDSSAERITRNAGAKIWIPSMDEWFKTAYHKNDGPTGNYWSL